MTDSEMDGEKDEFYDYDVPDDSYLAEETDLDKNTGLQLGFTEDFMDEFDEDDINETIMTHTYDSAFITKGPVVKMYQRADETTGKMQEKLTLPAFKDEEGNIVKPCNLMVHNQEKSLIFSDKHD